MNGLLASLSTAKGVTYVAVLVLAVLVLVSLSMMFRINYFRTLKKVTDFLAKRIGRRIVGYERRYYRDLTIGRLHQKRLRVRTYRFLNDLIIDLGLKRRGATPYEFLFFVIVAAVIVAIAAGALLGSKGMAILLFPIIFAAIMCGLYTKANLAHDGRIDSVIEAENIISNNIKGGVVVSIRSSVDLMPENIRSEFKDFLDNVEHKNYHVVTALMELNNNLGTVADDFIKKCIMFETEEEHGYAGIFRDVVEINNIKTAIRNDTKRKFEKVKTDFMLSVTITFTFLLGSMIIYEIIAAFYLQTGLGNILLAMDAFFVVLEFVVITWLRAKEL